MKRHVNSSVLLGGIFLLISFSCQQPEKSTADTSAADEAALRQADVDWSKTIEAKQVDGHNAYFVEDAVVLAPNEEMWKGRDSIRKKVSAFIATPGFAMKWQPTKVEVAHSGDLAYTMGTYNFSMNDAKGKAMNDHGKYLTVWKKQADGSWKVAVDMFNSDLPAPQP